MSILISENILQGIKDELSKSTESFLLISAFCKLPLVKYFDTCIGNKSLEKRLVVRFRLSDILAGASDLALYPYCKKNGWRLFFRLDLHAKTYIFDRLRCIVGSANATRSGMNVGGQGNFEIATACELSETDAASVEKLLHGCVEIDDNIYQIMLDIVEKGNHDEPNEADWPKDIEDMFNPDYSLLFAEDFPICSSPQEASEENLMFLNLATDASIHEISKAFSKTKSFLWLCDLIQKQDTKEMYFGEISVNLHNCLLNDPKPYRKDVKFLLSNLLSWIDYLQVEELLIDRPNYSQRVRYRG